MAELHAFFDKDVIIKLACCDLWDDAIEALGVSHPYRLVSATPKGSRTALRRMDIPDILRDAAVARLQVIAEDVPVIPAHMAAAAVTTDLYNAKINTENNDPREAELAIVTKKSEYEIKLISGDKRFIQAIEASFPGEFNRLRPVYISFEQCLLAICALRGFENVRERLLAASGCDRTLRLSLGADGQAAEDQFFEGLRSFSPV